MDARKLVVNLLPYILLVVLMIVTIICALWVHSRVFPDEWIATNITGV